MMCLSKSQDDDVVVMCLSQSQVDIMMMCLSKSQDDEIMMCLSKSQDKHVCSKPCYRASHQAVLKGVVRVRASLRFSHVDIMLMCLSKSQDDHDDVSVEITGW